MNTTHTQENTLKASMIYRELGPAIRQSMVRPTLQKSRKNEDILAFEAGGQDFLIRHDYGDGLHLLWITPEGRARYDALAANTSGWQELRDCIRFAAKITRQDRMETHCWRCTHPRKVFEGTMDFRCRECGAGNLVSIDEWSDKWRLVDQ